MARRTIEERIAVEQARRAVLDARLRKLEAKDRQAKQTRRNQQAVLIGHLVLDEIERGDDAARRLRKWLAERLPDRLTRKADRELMQPVLEHDRSDAGD